MSEKEPTTVLGKRKSAEPPICVSVAKKPRVHQDGGGRISDDDDATSGGVVDLKPVVFVGGPASAGLIVQLLRPTHDACPEMHPEDHLLYVVRAQKYQTTSEVRSALDWGHLAETNRPYVCTDRSVELTKGAGAAGVGDLYWLPVRTLLLGNVLALERMRLPRELEELRLQYYAVRDMLPVLAAAAGMRLRTLVVTWYGISATPGDAEQLSTALSKFGNIRRLFLVYITAGWHDIDLPFASNLEYLHVCGNLRLQVGARGPKVLSLQQPGQLEGSALADVEYLRVDRAHGSLRFCAGAFNVVRLALNELNGFLLLLDRLKTVYLDDFTFETDKRFKICILSYRRLRYALRAECEDVERPAMLCWQHIRNNKHFHLQHTEVQELFISSDFGAMVDLNLVVDLVRMVYRPKLSLRELCMQQAVASHLSQRAVGAHRLPVHVQVEISQRVEEVWNM